MDKKKAPFAAYNELSYGKMRSLNDSGPMKRIITETIMIIDILLKIFFLRELNIKEFAFFER